MGVRRRRLVDDVTGEVLSSQFVRISTGRPRPFRRLACRRSADLHIFDDRDLIARILAGAGLFCGLQNSVIRRRVFDCLRFETASRNEAEDQVFVIRAIAAGFRLAYFVDVHHVYHVLTIRTPRRPPGESASKGKRESTTI